MYVYKQPDTQKKDTALLSSSFTCVLLHCISVSSYSSAHYLRQKFCFALQIQTMYFRAAVIFRNALLILLNHRQNL